MKIRNACIFGGTGFVGRHLIPQLSKLGIQCTVISRHPQRHRNLKIGNTQLIQIDNYNKNTLEKLLTNFDMAINLVGILNSDENNSFESIHVELSTNIAEACRLAGVKRLLHMSALNAHETLGVSQYLRSKGKAENNVMTLTQPNVAVTAFRPSVIFGSDDSFFNRFAKLVRVPGYLPLACANTRFAPVYVEDVAAAFCVAASNTETAGKIYELCGPGTKTLKQLVEYTAWHQGIYKTVIPLSDRLSRLQAKILQHMPGKPFTIDNYLSCSKDSVCKHNGLQELGIEATAIDTIMPALLQNKDRNSRYSLLRAKSGR